MKRFLRIALIGLLSSALVACSSDDDGGSSQAQNDSPIADGGNNGMGDGDNDTPINDGSNDTLTPDGIVFGTDDTAPEIINPQANAIPNLDASDPFNSLQEIDPEAASTEVGAAPTTPKNLRIDLVSNDWAEFSWAPSNGDVVAYNIYRSDGHVYTVGRDQTDPVQGTQDEIDKFWATTSFIDCNYTRFFDRLHACGDNGPKPGDTFTYEVTAVGANGAESAASNSIEITFHIESNAAIPTFSDFYLSPVDDFLQRNDLSDTSMFLDEFELVFDEEFDGGSIDGDKWNTGLTWGDTRIINGEQQYFVNTQAQPDFGYDPFQFGTEETGESIMAFEAVPTPDNLVANLPPICEGSFDFGPKRCSFLSGALSSHDKFGMLYGYLEGRMQVGSTPGMLSSFYLYHRYPGEGVALHAPEIDVVEYLGENPFGDEDAFQTYHFTDVNTGIIRSAPTMSFKKPEGDLYGDAYHTFGVLWEPQTVIWYIDGKEVKRMTGPQVSRQPKNIVNYLVAGSAWAPTPADNPDIYPLQYKVDYIKAYQRPIFGCGQGNISGDSCASQ